MAYSYDYTRTLLTSKGRYDIDNPNEETLADYIQSQGGYDCTELCTGTVCTLTFESELTPSEKAEVDDLVSAYKSVSAGEGNPPPEIDALDNYQIRTGVVSFGTGSSDKSRVQTITYDVPFLSKTVSVVATSMEKNTNVYADEITKTGFKLRTSGNSWGDVSWLALGE